MLFDCSVAKNQYQTDLAIPKKGMTPRVGNPDISCEAVNNQCHIEKQTITLSDMVRDHI